MKSKLIHKIFHSKVLLYGEQIINKGAMGLAVPFDHFHGVLKYADNIDLRDKKIFQSNKALGQLANHLVHQESLSGFYDTNKMLEDIENGLYFDSDILQGYGLGSSGALVAALYFQYRQNRRKNFTLAQIKKELADMESYFHGTSSGLDPIVCYLNQAVLVTNGEVTDTFDLPKSEAPKLKFFLINTHIERKTAPFVNLFLEKCKDKKFMKTVETSLIPTNNIAVESFLNKKHDQLLNATKLISQLQFDMLPDFIPPKFRDVWQRGLKYNEFHLKLCGAGGGGFIIGLTKHDADLPLLLHGGDVIDMMAF